MSNCFVRQPPVSSLLPDAGGDTHNSRKKNYLSYLVWPSLPEKEEYNSTTVTFDPTSLIQGLALNREQGFISDESFSPTLCQFWVTEGELNILGTVQMSLVDCHP